MVILTFKDLLITTLFSMADFLALKKARDPNYLFVIKDNLKFIKMCSIKGCVHDRGTAIAPHGSF